MTELANSIHDGIRPQRRSAQYRITWNGVQSAPIDGDILARDGYAIQLR